jgi:hypothetical protein
MRIKTIHLDILLLTSSFIEVAGISIGGSSFKIIPFHLTLLLYLILAIFFHGTNIRLKINKKDFVNFLYKNLLLFVFVVQVIISQLFIETDPLQQSFRKVSVMLLYIFIGVVFIYGNRNDSRIKTIIHTSTRFLVLLQLGGILLQFFTTAGLIHFPDWIGDLFSSVDVNNSLLSEDLNLFKARGIFTDANRGAVTISSFLSLSYLIDSQYKAQKQIFKVKPEQHSRNNELELFFYLVGVLEIFLSLSRKGWVCLLIFSAIVAFNNPRFKKPIIVIPILISIIVASYILFMSSSTDIFADYTEAVLFSSRRQASTDVHFQLLYDGINIGFSNLKTLLFGKGWGTEYVYAGKYFTIEEKAFANFHSGFISAFVQSGILCLVSISIYMIKPLFGNKKYGQISYIMIWSNLFYTFYIQPTFWILLILLNSTLNSWEFNASRTHDQELNSTL